MDITRSATETPESVSNTKLYVSILIGLDRPEEATKSVNNHIKHIESENNPEIFSDLVCLLGLTLCAEGKTKLAQKCYAEYKTYSPLTLVHIEQTLFHKNSLSSILSMLELETKKRWRIKYINTLILRSTQQKFYDTINETDKPARWLSHNISFTVSVLSVDETSARLKGKISQVIGPNYALHKGGLITITDTTEEEDSLIINHTITKGCDTFEFTVPTGNRIHSLVVKDKEGTETASLYFLTTF